MKKYSDEEILESLNRSMKSVTPNNFNEIKSSLRKKGIKMKKKFNYAWMPTTILATVVLVFIGVYYNNNYVVDSLIGIDVNPSVEIETSKNNKVVSVNALNEGGVKILDNMDLKQVDINIAINALIGSMIKYGYLTGDDANILVSVKNSNEVKSIAVKDLVVSSINGSLDGSEVSATVLNQTITTNDKNVDDLAKTNNISYGKALFINELIKKDSSLDFNTLAEMSLRELAALVESKNIDINDIVESDDDDSTKEKIEEKIEDANEEKKVNDNSNGVTYLSKEEVKNIAFKHAGVSSDTNVNITLGKDGGKAVYDIDFKTSEKEYDYEIDATSGKVLDFESEKIKTKPQNNTNTNNENTNQNQTTNYIGESKAKSVALNHAGVSSSEASMLKIVLDTENGTKVYDIQFRIGDVENEYEINATTGSIVNHEKDIDD